VVDRRAPGLRGRGEPPSESLEGDFHRREDWSPGVVGEGATDCSGAEFSFQITEGVAPNRKTGDLKKGSHS